MEQEVIVKVIAPGAASIAVIPNLSRISVTQEPQVQTIRIALGPQGKDGPVGPAGAGSTITATAGGTISGGTAVVMIDGLLYPADPTNLSHADRMVGIATQAGNIGDPVIVAQGGELDGESYSGENVPLFVGLNGILSESPVAPGATWQQRVGTTKSTSALIIVLQPPINIST